MEDHSLKFFLGNAPTVGSRKPEIVAETTHGLGLPRLVHVLLPKGTGGRRGVCFCIVEFANAVDVDTVAERMADVRAVSYAPRVPTLGYGHAERRHNAVRDRP